MWEQDEGGRESLAMDDRGSAVGNIWGIVLGDIYQLSVQVSGDVFKGRSLQDLLPEAISLRTLRTD